MNQINTLYQSRRWPAIHLRRQNALTRGNDDLVLYEQAYESFQYATHERPFIDAVLNDTQETGWTQTVLEARDWKNDLRYWIALLRHTDEEIRKIAAGQIERLSDQTVMLEPPKSPAGVRPWWDEDLGVNPPLHIEKEYARLIDWYDANK